MTLDTRAKGGLYKVFIAWRGYFIGVGLVVLATILGHLVQTFFTSANIIMVYPLCVTISAIIGGLGPSVLVSILSVLAFDFFFVTPFYTFAVDDTQYIFTFIVLLAVGITISYLTSRTRRQTETARQREREMAALYALGRDFVISVNRESYIKAIITRIKEALGREVMVFLHGVETSGILKGYTNGGERDIGEEELAAATRSFQHRQTILTGTKSLYLPLVTARKAIGVLAIKSSSIEGELTAEQDRLLGAYTDLVAVALEGIQLAEELRTTAALKATEKLQAALINAISHDLRTPLVTVIGTLSSLQEESMSLDDIAKKNLIQVAREEADRLNHIITNLLDESRIEAGAITLSRQPSEVQDLIVAALEQLGSRVSARSVIIDIPAETPFFSVDVGLIVQALYNVLDNAMKYSPIDSTIEINVSNSNREVYIKVIDHGIGIPEQDMRDIFNKFYRVNKFDNVAGTGLGLSISKGFIEAHGGAIKAEKGSDGATVIRITLPVFNPNSNTEGR